jgi:hypothetical protein
MADDNAKKVRELDHGRGRSGVVRDVRRAKANVQGGVETDAHMADRDKSNSTPKQGGRPVPLHKMTE